MQTKSKPKGIRAIAGEKLVPDLRSMEPPATASENDAAASSPATFYQPVIPQSETIQLGPTDGYPIKESATPLKSRGQAETAMRQAIQSIDLSQRAVIKDILTLRNELTDNLNIVGTHIGACCARTQRLEDSVANLMNEKRWMEEKIEAMEGRIKDMEGNRVAIEERDALLKEGAIKKEMTREVVKQAIHKLYGTTNISKVPFPRSLDPWPMLPAADGMTAVAAMRWNPATTATDGHNADQTARLKKFLESETFIAALPLDTRINRSEVPIYVREQTHYNNAIKFHFESFVRLWREKQKHQAPVLRISDLQAKIDKKAEAGEPTQEEEEELRRVQIEAGKDQAHRTNHRSKLGTMQKSIRKGRAFCLDSMDPPDENLPFGGQYKSSTFDMMEAFGCQPVATLLVTQNGQFWFESNLSAVYSEDVRSLQSCGPPC